MMSRWIALTWVCVACQVVGGEVPVPDTKPQVDPVLVAQLGHSSNLIESVAFSPDGKQVLTAGDTTARLWDTASGKEIRVFRHANDVMAAVFSPDGKWVLTSGPACRPEKTRPDRRQRRCRVSSRLPHPRAGCHARFSFALARQAAALSGPSVTPRHQEPSEIESRDMLRNLRLPHQL